MGKKSGSRGKAKMEITPVHCEGYEYELFSCCDEPGTLVYSWLCSPCMAGQIQAVIHPEVGCGRTCILTACCPILYVAEPMDKFQAKFHFGERAFIDKWCIDSAVICFCLPCELTREWRQVANYEMWILDGGLETAEQEANKGVYEEQGTGGTAVPAPTAPNPYQNQAAPNPYANQQQQQQAPNPYANQQQQQHQQQAAPNPYANQQQQQQHQGQGQTLSYGGNMDDGGDD